MGACFYGKSGRSRAGKVTSIGVCAGWCGRRGGRGRRRWRVWESSTRRRFEAGAGRMWRICWQGENQRRARVRAGCLSRTARRDLGQRVRDGSVWMLGRCRWSGPGSLGRCIWRWRCDDAGAAVLFLNLLTDEFENRRRVPSSHGPTLGKGPAVNVLHALELHE